MRLLFAIVPAAAAFGLTAVAPASAQSFSFSTGPATNQIGVASRPDAGGLFEIEAADDFALTTPVTIGSATFTGLIPVGATVQDIVLEIYRVFPNDSNVGRTSGAPVFSTSQVPTRVNSPSDVAFDSRDSAAGGLSFTTTTLATNFTASNSVQPGGIHLATGGNGAVTGNEVEFDVTLNQPFELPADHYFFVPQVQLNGTNTFLWLSGQRPVAFPPGFNDLQSWTRDAMLDPDWLRVGTDIVGAGTFNQAFSVAGTLGIPEPASLSLLGMGIAGLAALRRRRSGNVG
jgi:hypothetical protein